MGKAAEIPLTAAQQKARQADRIAKLVTLRNCRDCGEQIFFAKTHHGKSLPIDPDKVERYANDFIIDADNVVHVTPLVPRHKCEPVQVYRKVSDVLRDHPDLEPVWQQFRDGPMGAVYNSAKHERAKKAWADALTERRIRLHFADASVGFGADEESAGTEWPIDSDGSPKAKSLLLPSPYGSDGA